MHHNHKGINVNTMQGYAYFLAQYGAQRGLTVMHRMRTWYNHKAKVAKAKGEHADSTRFANLSAGMTFNIDCAKGSR